MRRGASALVWLAAAVASVSVGLHAGPLPWRFAGDSGLPARSPAAPAAPAAAPVSIASILALAPFGRIAPPEAPEAPVEETALGLTLHGVVIATSQQASSAIVSTADSPARAYGVGDEVADGATLLEVHSGHVVLRVDGRTETLSFPEARSARGPRIGMESGAAALRALVTGGEATAPIAPVDTDPEAVIARYRSQIRTNPQVVLDGLGLEATNGGYVVGQSATARVRRAGLQPGDVVEKVNGQQVGNIERDRDLFDEVAASGRARIEVVRDGQRVVMSFPLR